MSEQLLDGEQSGVEQLLDGEQSGGEQLATGEQSGSKWPKRLFWLVAVGLLVGWGLTWGLDSPLRPVLAQREGIRNAVAHVSGTACGTFIEGTGFMVEPGLVITNAHVVAGIDRIEVGAPGRGPVIATLAGFDPGRDIAALSVPDLGASPVALSSKGAVATEIGDVATVDSDGKLVFVPFEVTARRLDVGRDFYGQQTQGRDVLEISSTLAAGDSGAALVNISGEVVGMAFGIHRGRQNPGYALDGGEIADFLAETDRTPIPTPPCRTL
ncbi:trypsin-like peptidase domain-containing protein [Candidatus Poriferisocius sp.]|uniref:trypsin-like peptidase domain-containing protein n=1 Tax=Candidatus Poriferisocius sp. TaxID=3101276 RepID=UPI003B02CD01